jgi:demethylspheroidene O-methyltransferase
LGRLGRVGNERRLPDHPTRSTANPIPTTMNEHTLAPSPFPPTWGDRWCLWRDRLVGSARFQHWASGFVLTRPLARKRARELFDIVAGFVYSQVLLACVRLKLFEMLAGGALSRADIATRLDLPVESVHRLIDAAVSLRLFETRAHGRIGLGPLGAPLVGNDAVLAMVEHHATLYRDLADPVALLRGSGQGTELGQCFPYANAASPGALPDQDVAAYSALMTASQPLVAQEILAAYPFEKHRSLLDVAGGEGRFLRAAALACPQLQLTLFDLPAVARRGAEAFEQAGLGGRARAVGGDFLLDDLPTGADLCTLIRVAHDHDDARVMRLFKAIRKALPADGTLVLAEPMSGTAGAEPMGDAYFGFYLLAMGRGRPRKRDELTAMLQAAGFDRVRALPSRLPLQVGLLVARVAPAP